MIEDQHTISRGHWLNDNIITAFQDSHQLLNKQYPLISCLQDKILREIFKLEPQTNKFLQVLHVGGNH